MAESTGPIPTPCDCGFTEDDLEFCFNGMIHSDLFRRIIETPCECDCHSSVPAVLRPKPKYLVCHECRMSNSHKMDCSVGRAVPRELIAA